MENDPTPDPREFPPDTKIAEWATRYGTTGVKTYSLAHPRNKGCVAVYREISMAERQVLGRMKQVEEDHPGAYDYERMIASTCLLHPTIASYPHPAFAAAELFNRIRAHGHAPLDQEEEIVSGEGVEDAGLPRHVVDDMRNAREVAYRAFHDPEVKSVYTDLIVDMATDADSGVDPQTLDYLWQLPPGRLRDLAARLEQANADVRKEALAFLEANPGDLEQEQLEARAEQIEQQYAPPFETIDHTVGDAATPDLDAEEEEETQGQEEAQGQKPEPRDTDEDLPPNSPPAVREGIEQAVQQQ